MLNKGNLSRSFSPDCSLIFYDWSMFTTFLQTRRYHLFAFSFPETPLFPVHKVTELKKRALSLGTTGVFSSFLAFLVSYINSRNAHACLCG